jgi:hypothetical protein
MDLSSTEPSRIWRLAGASVLFLLLFLGVTTMGARLDAVTLGMTECLKNEEACIGQRLDLAYLRVAQVRDRGFVMHGQGFDMEVVDWAGPELPARLGLVRVSVSGVYLGQQRMTGERGMVHRFRKVKEIVGAGVLLGWMWSVAGFIRRRNRG